ncbi:unnamed protein product [Ectocarpus sp. 12 AP-2014]
MPGDVVGSDLSEDSREIVLTLLKEHAARVKNTKQRRGSCPAIPRTMMATAVHAAGTGTINGASVPAAAPLLLSSPTAPSHKPGTLLPLPSVVVTNKNAGEIDAETAVGGANSNQAGGQATRHVSFSVADRIRVRVPHLLRLRYRHVIFRAASSSQNAPLMSREKGVPLRTPRCCRPGVAHWLS